MFSKRTPLDFTLFLGAFLAIQGLLSFQWTCFGCNQFINGIPVSFYQNLLMLVGFALFIGSLSLMLLGATGTKNKLPSKHSMLDFLFAIGPFLFINGFASINSWGGWSELISVPLVLIDIELIGVSSYYLRRDYTKKGEHDLAWELIFLVSLGLLLIVLFVSPSGQAALPFVNLYFSTPQYEFLVVSVVGMIIGIQGLRNVSKKKTWRGIGIDENGELEQQGGVAEKGLNKHTREKGVLFGSVAVIAILSLSWFLAGYYNNNGCGGGFGSFGCNVKTIQLNSATLFAGPLPPSANCSSANSAYMTLALNNPGAATNIMSLNISGFWGGSTTTSSSLNTTVTPYYLKGSNNICTQISTTNQPKVNANAITNLTVYLGGQPVSTLVKNVTYGYAINFLNGESISGSLQAQ